MVKFGDVVKKTSGDYRFTGTVVSEFRKLGGERRLVVEDDRGLLLILNPKQVECDDHPRNPSAPARDHQGSRPSNRGNVSAQADQED